MYAGVYASYARKRNAFCIISINPVRYKVTESSKHILNGTWGALFFCQDCHFKYESANVCVIIE